MTSPEQHSYFVRFRGRISGPFSFERLRSMASASQVSEIHELSSDRSAWFPASDLPGLLPDVREPASAPQKSVARTEATAPAEKWYYLDASDNRTGPIGRRELIDLHDCGTINEATSVWTNGMAEWVPFDQAGLVASNNRASIRLDRSSVVQNSVQDRRPGVGLGITGMVLGILSLLSSCFVIIPYAGIVFVGFQLILGVLAICFSAAGMRTQGRGLAIAGLVTGIIAVAIFVLLMVLIFVIVGSLAAALNANRNGWE
ncbi:MAG: DUF4339 domain-containing protein [Gemmataceae bacterium]|nr:DUF4339 domain-containing protein [Gemmataceae bacterium]